MPPQRIAALDSVLTADSVEFAPGAESRVFSLATYQLDKETGTRQGSFTVLRVGEAGLEELARRETAGVLDVKWAHGAQSRGLVGRADADGRLALLRFDDGQDALSDVGRVEVCEGICLSLDWSDRVAAAATRVVVSRNDGQISVVDPATETVELAWTGHGLEGFGEEVWIAAFNYWDPQVVWTGADDTRLKGWDRRTACARPSFVNKTHSMGVCTIQFHPHREHLCAVGSYDEHLRIFDARQPREPLSETHLGGGVWRVKWHPRDPRQAVAACMHNGFHVVEFEDIEADSAGTSVAHYTGHESLAYGVDWCLGDPSIVASCSFYDHLCHVWRV